MDVPITVANTADGGIALPSAAKGANGQPRFHLPLIRQLCSADAGIQHLLLYEGIYSGYESPSRLFFDEHLQPGDWFIDVGAHWGMFSLSAATRWPGRVHVLAIEAHPQNVTMLLRTVVLNELTSSIKVVAAAAGAKRGIAPLNSSSTMGHSLVEVRMAAQPSLSVPVVPLDDLLASKSGMAKSRVFLKIDVEGSEYEVILGAKKLLDSGRVAAVMWEHGESFNKEPGIAKRAKLIEEFYSRGYTLHRFPSHDMGGPLIPFAPTPEIGNVFALAPDFERKPLYPQPFDKRPPFNRELANPAAPERGPSRPSCWPKRSSDGARWADLDELPGGANERAMAVAALIPPGSKVLDVGAGAMALAAKLPTGCTYEPADLIARSATCQVIDLNQAGFPTGEHDVTVLSEVLEYIHDVPALLTRCREAASRLVCTYQARQDESIDERRGRGWFNDYTADEFAKLLKKTRWKVLEQTTVGPMQVVSCQTADAS